MFNPFCEFLTSMISFVRLRKSDQNHIGFTNGIKLDDIQIFIVTDQNDFPVHWPPVLVRTFLESSLKLMPRYATLFILRQYRPCFNLKVELIW